jgi:hypothetical protein
MVSCQSPANRQEATAALLACGSARPALGKPQRLPPLSKCPSPHYGPVGNELLTDPLALGRLRADESGRRCSASTSSAEEVSGSKVQVTPVGRLNAGATPECHNIEDQAPA